MAVTMLEDSVPLVLEKYEPIRRIAAGGMGEVYLARQVGLAGFQRLIALKRLLPNLADDPEFVRQFLDEARMVATVSHPNVVSIYEVGRSLGTYYIAMELIRGPSLDRLDRHLSEKDEQIPIHCAVSIARDVALGLQAVHGALGPNDKPLHLVHRDISPHNIMVSVNGTAHIVDFGIAKAANRLGNTETGLIKGKLSYMAIEQLRGEPVDGRADQFSLGVVLWQLLTGDRLFSTENLVDLVNERVVRAPSDLNKNVPPALDRMIVRMLSHRTEDRYSSCAEVAHELEDVLHSSPIPSPESTLAEIIKRELGDTIAHELANRTPTAELSAELRQMLTATTPLPQPEETVWEHHEARKQRPKTFELSPQPVLPKSGPAIASGPSFRTPRRKSHLGRLLIIMFLSAVAMFLWYEGVPQISKGESAKIQKAPNRKKKAKRKKVTQGTTTGYLNIKTTPWSEVWIDGEFVGSTPIYRRAVSPGKHVVRMVNSFEGVKSRQSVTVTEGKLTTIDLKLAP